MGYLETLAGDSAELRPPRALVRASQGPLIVGGFYHAEEFGS